MIGDHRNDVLAACGARSPSIFAASGHGAAGKRADADAVLEDLAEVPVVAARLLDAARGPA